MKAGVLKTLGISPERADKIVQMAGQCISDQIKDLGSGVDIITFTKHSDAALLSDIALLKDVSEGVLYGFAICEYVRAEQAKSPPTIIVIDTSRGTDT